MTKSRSTRRISRPNRSNVGVFRAPTRQTNVPPSLPALPVRQVFKDFDYLGWYSTGPEPTAAEIHVHEQFATFNESPLYVQLFPNVVATSKDLPIAVYESVIDIVDGKAQTLFVKSQYRVETMEAERIAVNHVAKAAAIDATEGSGGEPLGQRDTILSKMKKEPNLLFVCFSPSSDPTSCGTEERNQDASFARSAIAPICQGC